MKTPARKFKGTAVSSLENGGSTEKDGTPGA